MIALIGDVGGTKTILQLISLTQNINSKSAHVLHERKYFSSDYESFEQLVGVFLKCCNISNYPEVACIGVAGPVETTSYAQKSRLTKLLWEIDSTRLSRELGIKKVKVLNDFEAIAYGVLGLDESSKATIQKGTSINNKTKLVVGAGTGLGMCILFWNGKKYEAIPTEGGHIGFSPCNEEQDYIHHRLRECHGRNSVERMVSGPGLEKIYNILCEKHGIKNELAQYDNDQAAEISRLAHDQNDSLAVKALTIFTQCYGSFIGDAALSCLATGGVFIAGGIAPKIQWRLSQPDFVQSICAKGRMERILRKIPVSVVLNEKVGLIGAAMEALHLIDDGFFSRDKPSPTKHVYN